MLVPLIKAADGGTASRGKEGVVKFPNELAAGRGLPAQDDRAVLPLGSTEQHAQLSLSVDSILSERVAVEAAEPLGVPVFPGRRLRHHALFLGLSRLHQPCASRPMCGSVRDILDSLQAQGFRRILIVNGHGGNQPARPWRSSGWPTIPRPP